MKGLIRIFVWIFLIGSISTSCTENDLLSGGEGTLSLNVNINNGLPTVSAGTRATITDEELLQKCKVYIRNSEGLVRKYATLNEMPDKILLVSNNYKAEVTAGDSVSASFTDSYFKGVKDFTISTGQTVSESVVCGIQNTVISVNLSDELVEAFPTYTITINNRMGKLIYTPDNIDQLGYFMLLDDENQLKWNFTGQVEGSEATIVKSGVINLVKKSTKYDLIFSNSPSEVGGGMVSVKVIETALSSDLNVELQARPVIKVIENANMYELDNPVYRAKGDTITPILVRMAASVPFEEIKISSLDFSRLGIDKFLSFDWKGLTTTQIRELDVLGFKIEFNSDTTKVQFAFDEKLREIMTSSIEEGENTYTFNIELKDRNGKTRKKSLIVKTTDALVATEEIPEENTTWATKATLYGSLVANTTEMNFRYRIKGASDDSWKFSEQSTLNNKIFTSEIADLTPGTTYEYQAMSGSVAAKDIREFMTESSAQLPNAGFEDWYLSGKILYAYKSGGSMFWDSGNTGSSTMSVNVTTNDSGTKHGGTYSAQLKSQFVGVLGIGAFAAGNVFIGKFIKIDGTNGILRFGRPFTTRPSALKLYYKYNTGTVDYSSHAEAPKGSKDKGHIYIALGDWQRTQFESESDIPVLIKTRPGERQLFDPTSSNVIGYGEYVINESTTESGLIELIIPIKYRSDRKPTDIVVVGTASKYGDYFTGSTSSTLWLDDLELIYEDVEI